MLHKKASWFILFILITATAFAECDREGERAQSQTAPTKIEDVEGVKDGNLWLDGRVYIAGQPTESAIEEFGRRGVTIVVNVRTPEEVEDREEVPFDEGRFVRDLGMAYVSIPLGGEEFPYEPAAVERLAEALASNDGAVLIHCTYGWRAAYLWLAYLIQHEGLELEQAMSRGEAMMLKAHPVGRLLGRPTKLVFSP